MNIFTSNKREAELLEQIESLNAKVESLNSLKSSHQQLNDDYAKLQASYDKLQQAYARLTEQQTAREPATPNQPDNAANAESSAHAATDLTPLIERLDKLSDMRAVNDRKDEIIKDLHNEVQNLSRDVFSQFTKPFLTSIIRIYTYLAEEIEAGRREFFDTGSKEAEIAYKRMGTSLQMVEDTLLDEFDAVKFAPVPGDAYEPRSHYAVKSIVTDDPALAGTVSACRQSGFKNAETGKIIKQAVVIVYRLNNAK